MALYELKKEGWKPLPQESADSLIAFVDGGNAEIVKTPSAEIHRIRTATVATSGSRIAMVRQKEGYLIVKAAVKDRGKTGYKAQLFDSNLDHPVAENNGFLELESFGISPAAAENDGSGLGRAARTTRRLLELATGTAAAKELWKNSEGGAKKLIVLDGTLETFSSKEKSEMESLLAAASGNNIIVGAVAKTCSLLTTEGEPLIAAADRISEGKDGYIIVAHEKSERHKATACVARLNQNASYLFRVETAAAGDLETFLAALKLQSNDVAFPGYPYGLIMADRFARISDNDAEITKSKMAATANAEMKELLKQEKAINAHRILDSM